MLQLYLPQEHELSLLRRLLCSIDDVVALGHRQFQGVGGIHITLQIEHYGDLES